LLVESVLLRDIQLPQTLKASIEAKQQAEQEALAMNFRLQKEKQEAERKRIEAAGIRDFQQIVARASAHNCSNGRESRPRSCFPKVRTQKWS
jgi:regulator of protease activity HflC (stomatin/prohibitin superfamily)